MRRFRLQVFFGLFFSAFIRFGICFLFFVIGMLLSPVNKMFFYFGIACLIFEVVVALADAIRCMSAAKNANSGNPDVDEVFKVIFTDDYDDPEVELAKALTKLTGGTFHGPEPVESIYRPIAEEMKSRITEKTTTEEAVAIFRELVESSGIEDETITFTSSIERRQGDWKKYFVMSFHLVSSGHMMHFTMYYKHTFSDPNTILEIICDEGREAFYQEVYDHQRYQKRASEIPLHMDVIL